MKTIARLTIAAVTALTLAAAPSSGQLKIEAVPAPFREAVGKELKLGMTIAEVQEAPATAAGRYVAVVYKFPEGDVDHGEDKALKLYFLPAAGKTVTATDLAVDHIVDFGTYEDDKTVFADVNGDGAPEMIVSVANGGNCWQCSRVMLFTLDTPTARLVASEPMTLKDLDGDGRPELLVGDTRWESYDNFAHALAPGGTLVYTWRDGKYVFAGSDAAEFYRGERARLQSELPAAIKAINDDPMSDDIYLSILLCSYLIDVYTAKGDSAREELRRLMGEHVTSDEMRQRRKTILDDFLTGESAGLLKEPQKGQPLARPEAERP